MHVHGSQFEQPLRTRAQSRDAAARMRAPLPSAAVFAARSQQRATQQRELTLPKGHNLAAVKLVLPPCARLHRAASAFAAAAFSSTSISAAACTCPTAARRCSRIRWRLRM